MNISILSLLLGLGGKCLLNWALVFLQRSHICRSFVGVFSLSLSVVDTVMTLIFVVIHIYTDDPVFLLDWQLTRYHTCLLVQILGQVYSLLQWPVVLVASLDHVCTVSLPAASSGLKGIVYSCLTVLLWTLTVLYVFLLSDFDPVLEDVSHHQVMWCWVSHTTQILQVFMLLSSTLACSVLHAVCSSTLLENPPEKNQITNQSKTPSRRSIVFQVLSEFLSTWAPLLIFLAMLLLLPVGIPSYLGLNVAWLCFLNSFLITLVLCVACPTPRLAQALAAVPGDSFCEWRIKFN